MEIIKLKKSDPVFLRICKGLAAPFSSIMNPDDSSDQQENLYDYLNNGDADFEIMLMAGVKNGVRMDQFRPYWSAAFMARVLGVQPNVELGPKAYASSDLDDTNGSIAADVVGLPNVFENISYDQPYPPEIVKEFGPELQTMDAEWRAYIADASVTLRGQRRSLFQAGVPAALLHFSRLSDLEKPEFWQELGDGRRVLQQEVCLAARFAIDYGYVTAGELPDYGKCGARMYVP